jgi:hypothetical protein
MRARPSVVGRASDPIVLTIVLRAGRLAARDYARPGVSALRIIVAGPKRVPVG